MFRVFNSAVIHVTFDLLIPCVSRFLEDVYVAAGRTNQFPFIRAGDKADRWTYLCASIMRPKELGVRSGICGPYLGMFERI